jgi:hypothetical protein
MAAWLDLGLLRAQFGFVGMATLQLFGAWRQWFGGSSTLPEEEEGWVSGGLDHVGDGRKVGSRPRGLRVDHGVPATMARCSGGSGVNKRKVFPIPMSMVWYTWQYGRKSCPFEGPTAMAHVGVVPLLGAVTEVRRQLHHTQFDLVDVSRWNPRFGVGSTWWHRHQHHPSVGSINFGDTD